jgi:pimeloyl-ACP methyl ester carboxylesterase
MSVPEPALSPAREGYELCYRKIHGYWRAFVQAGRGPALLLIHGIGDRSDTWQEIIPMLARDYRVIAPDLLGHGRSDKPRADYSVAGYANAMRDLLTYLDVEHATVVGHSLGGGVAMQFAYQYPERCERLVLVSAGGVGREVNPVLRVASSPAGELLLPILRVRLGRAAAGTIVAFLRWLETDLGRDSSDWLRVLDALPDAVSQRAFVRTLRAVVDYRGQVVTGLDRCYLAASVPTLLMWGTRDAIVPFLHAQRAHAAMPSSRLEVFVDAGHFPHHHDPERFVSVLRQFIATTPPATHSPVDWRARLLRGRPGV